MGMFDPKKCPDPLIDGSEVKGHGIEHEVTKNSDIGWHS